MVVSELFTLVNVAESHYICSTVGIVDRIRRHQAKCRLIPL